MGKDDTRGTACAGGPDCYRDACKAAVSGRDQGAHATLARAVSAIVHRRPRLSMELAKAFNGVLSSSDIIGPE